MNPELLNLVKSDWRPYNKFPKLKGKASQIAVDVETYDPNLLKNGPGAIRKDGYVIGFSIATPDGFKGYYPIRHEGPDNLKDPDKAIRWLRHQLSDNTPKVGANILYDLIWLKCDLDIEVKGPKFDVQIAEPLLDENKFYYNLDSLADCWLKEGKRESMLYQAGKLLLGIKAPNSKGGIKLTDQEKSAYIIKEVKGKLWQLPARYVGQYGEYDADLPIRIFEKQQAELKEQGLWDLFLLESRLLDMLLDMWIQGVPVDVDKGVQARDQLQLEYDTALRKIKRRCGFTPNIWANEDIEKACKKLGLTYPLTDKGNSSFEADWLGVQDHAFFKLLLEARQLDRSGSIFIESKILDLEINGRIHPQFWQVKSDRYGTVAGRFSSSNPNGQQFPFRNERLAALVRGILTAEKGCKWDKADYSQQEFRITVHYANLLKFLGADIAAQNYIDNPDTDYHQFVADMTKLERKIAKNLNLALSYSMGYTKFGIKYNIPTSQAKKYFERYHKKLPFIKLLSKRCERIANQRGYIKTLLGRRRRFDLFGPPKWEKGIVPLKQPQAIEKYGYPVKRYFTYKALNSLSQGGAADQIKKAMIDCYDAGFLPCLTVHDALDFCNLTTKKEVKTIRDIMLNAIPLTIPMKVDCARGKNWGELKELKFK